MIKVTFKSEDVIYYSITFVLWQLAIYLEEQRKGSPPFTQLKEYILDKRHL